jgi:hypothetical protein
MPDGRRVGLPDGVLGRDDMIRKVLQAPLLSLAVLLACADYAMSQEFLLSSRWRYLQRPVATDIFGHGQADIFAKSSTLWLGSVGFYCAAPQPYFDIKIHKPPGRLEDEPFWGTPTIMTNLKLNGSSMPAAVEHGLISVDIDQQTRPVLGRAFELEPGHELRRIRIEVKDFARFDLIMKPIAPTTAVDGSTVMSFAAMSRMCDTTLDEQGLHRLALR